MAKRHELKQNARAHDPSENNGLNVWNEAKRLNVWNEPPLLVTAAIERLERASVMKRNWNRGPASQSLQSTENSSGLLLIRLELFYQIHDASGLVHQFLIKHCDFLAGDGFHVESRPFDLVQ